MVQIIDLTQDDEDDDLTHPQLQTTISLHLSPSLSSLLTSTPTLLPSRITSSNTNLPPLSHRTLLQKRSWLQTHTINTSQLLPTRSSASSAPPPPVLPHITPSTLLFAQEEAGSAVCISPNGLILSCAHCVAESPNELSWAKPHWLLFSNGRLVSAQLLAWDPKRDLSLLFITRSSAPDSAPFPHTPLSSSAPKPNTPSSASATPAPSISNRQTPTPPPGTIPSSSPRVPSAAFPPLRTRRIIQTLAP
ncbi:hypothetical protein PT974_05006 [Cladobotryum mycophilum]|uniref:Uncharacterized protein n=1 Tax=Cladobotryum mycophilum TaxID=491253 RepID=A0ABR0SQT0_9HYPO